MSLVEYRLKRNFDSTIEPRPLQAMESRQRFVIQKHDASHLHFDFRLEMKDHKTGQVVLKSWAIPKNIPFEKNVRHLAIQTEDHPVGYIDFEGVIPQGNYGAGKVEIWDKGKWGLMTGSIEEGYLKFNLMGEKARSRYHLFKTKGFGAEKDKKNYWLIWKQPNETRI